MTTKLRAVLKGQKGAVTRIVTKFDVLQAENEDRSNFDELKTMEETLRQKLQMITGIHEKILDTIPDDNADQIEAEVLDQEDYVYDLQMKIQKVCTLRKVTVSNLNANSQVFPHPASTDEASNSHIEPTLTEIVSTHSSIYHRLPKLDLPKFNGDILEWQSFWDSYESAIHTNPSLSGVQKFNYLKSSLRGEAVQTVAGFALTNVNYEKALSLLHERYGQKDKIIQRYMKALLEIPAPVYTVPSLRKFYDNTETYIRGLDSLGQADNTYGSLLTPVLLQKLPPEVRRNMTRAHGISSWCLGDLMRCLLNEVSILDAGNSVDPAQDFVATATFLTKSESRNSDKRRYTPPNSPRSKSATVCVYCKGQHSSTDCMNILDKDARMQIVKKKQLCFNCLGSHRVIDCKSRFKCKVCARRHHTSLCSDKQTTIKHNAKENHTSVLHSAHTYSTGPVLLKTAISTVQSYNSSTTANILFDEGSQKSFITKKLAEKLHLQPTGIETLCLSGFGDKESRVRHLETGSVYLQAAREKIEIKVLIVPEISVPLKTYQQQVRKLPYLQRLKLAHPMTGDEDFDIELLIGADHYWNVVQDKTIRGNGPTAIQSKIGYLLSGPLDTVTSKNSLSIPISMLNVMATHVQDEVDIEKFWKVESLGVEEVSENRDYDEYMKRYQDTCITHIDGKYYAKLPWKDEHCSLPSNEMISRRRTENVIKRLNKEPDMLRKYGEIIHDQEHRGFIEKVPETELVSDRKIHYIPHHPVSKDSATTPIRIVYDCSCKSARDSPSLNDCLMNTPPHLNDLTAILLRFRYNKYAVCTDIEKAFLNVGLHVDDRDVTRFFWLSDPDDLTSPLQVYRFKSVLFGATCSPFILNATILKHLDLHQCEETERIKKGLYVDNILTSVPDEKALCDLYGNSRSIFQQAAFNLRSWSSNNGTLRTVFESEGISDKDHITKVLGMRWDSQLDLFTFPQRAITHNNDSLLTKREILKESSSIFDPLGLLSPLTVKGKMLMQSLWQRRFDWDEVLPGDIIKEWCSIRADITQGTETNFSRCYFKEPTSTDVTLHVFTDASMKAYGACPYLVSGTQSTLIMAKNRVAPVKQLTIPKLELSATLIGARLCHHITSSIECTKVFLWSDSQIVLNWITSSKPQKVFVSNRVNEIQELTKDFEWRYCPTDTNPADLLSRGVTYDKFHSNSLWLTGPEWLTNETQFPPITYPMNRGVTDSKNEEHKTILLSNTEENTFHPGILNIVNTHRYSSYRKLLRVTAYIVRFINNCRHTEKKRGLLEPEELDTASRMFIKHSQNRHFPEITQCLSGNRSHTTVRKPNLVRQLDLYMDANSVIRCGGRISNAPLNELTRFPYLIPPKERLTELIIMDAHTTHLHSGLQSTVTFLRQRFWIPSIRQRVRAIIRTCVTCRKVSGPPYKVPDPPPLPSNRLKEAPPFTVTGVDFTGALTVKTPEGDLQKAYICLFTCASTRAVHLEIVPNMTVNSFILALRRFFSRMSTPKVILSDNALTFIATARILKEEVLNARGITWKFIPQHAPWYGGWWESLIGLTKNCTKKVLGKSLVSMEVLQTIITEVECIINDRPLTHTSSDPLDEEPLTPSHLLYGRRVTSPVYPDDRGERR